MKKVVFALAMFMFICGGSFSAMAQDPVKPEAETEEVQATEESSETESAEEAPAEAPAEAE